MILAGVDIGTLTCRLLIARLSVSGYLTELHADRRLLRLGEGVDQSRRLQPAAMDRVIETLQEWRAVVDGYQIEGEAAVATSAVRDAVNRGAFLERVKQTAGFEVELITGEEEARRTLLGIRSGLPHDVSDILGVDIGGGSTEFILDRRDQSPLVRSIDVGVVRLTERCLIQDPPSDDEIRTARQLVHDHTDGLRPLFGSLQNTAVVGTAGTITTLAAMAQCLAAYEPAPIHNYTLTLDVVSSIEREILSRTKAQRRVVPGLEAGREDVIVAGIVILKTILGTLGVQSCIVSDRGLREGVLLDLAAKLRAA